MKHHQTLPSQFSIKFQPSWFTLMFMDASIITFPSSSQNHKNDLLSQPNHLPHFHFNHNDDATILFLLLMWSAPRRKLIWKNKQKEFIKHFLITLVSRKHMRRKKGSVLVDMKIDIFLDWRNAVSRGWCWKL